MRYFAIKLEILSIYINSCKYIWLGTENVLPLYQK